jgi:hypothetical protein
VPELGSDYAKIVTFLAQNHMGFQHHASSKATQDSELSYRQQANTIYPIKALRWSIAYPGDDGVSPTPDTLAVAKKLGITMVPGDAGFLGTGTARALIGNIVRAGFDLCAGTDAMNVAPYPSFGMLAYYVTGETQDPSSVGLAADAGSARRPDRPRPGLLHRPEPQHPGHPLPADDRRRQDRLGLAQGPVGELRPLLQGDGRPEVGRRVEEHDRDGHARVSAHADPGAVNRARREGMSIGPAVAGPDRAQLPRGNRKNECGGT